MYHALAFLALCAPQSDIAADPAAAAIPACSGCGNMHYEARHAVNEGSSGWGSWTSWADFNTPDSCGPFGANDAEQRTHRTSQSLCDLSSGMTRLDVDIRVCGGTQSNNCLGGSNCDTKTFNNGFSVWMQWRPIDGHVVTLESRGEEGMQDNDMTVDVYTSEGGSTPCDSFDYTDMSTFYLNWVQVDASCQYAWSQLCGTTFDGSSGVPFATVIIRYKKSGSDPCEDTADSMEIQVRGVSDDCSGPTSPIDPIPDEEYSPALFVIVGSTIQGRTYRVAS